jgi:hypothetical protein
MTSQPGSTQDSVARDEDHQPVIADIGTRARSAQELPTSADDFDVSHDRELHHYDAVLNEKPPQKGKDPNVHHRLPQRSRERCEP